MSSPDPHFLDRPSTRGALGRAQESLARADLRLRAGRKLGRQRLGRALEALTPQRRDRLLEASVRHRADSAALALWASRCRPRQLCRQVSLSGWHHLTEAAARGAGVQLLTSWIGCWELLAAAVSHFHQPVAPLSFRPVCFWRRLARARLLARFEGVETGDRRLVVLDPAAAEAAAQGLAEVAAAALRQDLQTIPALAFGTGGGRARVILRPPIPAEGTEALLAQRLGRALAWEVKRRPAAWPWADYPWSDR